MCAVYTVSLIIAVLFSVGVGSLLGIGAPQQIDTDSPLDTAIHMKLKIEMNISFY